MLPTKVYPCLVTTVTIGGEQIPYCIDTETVSCETMSPVHPSPTYKLRLRRRVCARGPYVASASNFPAQVRPTLSSPKTGRSNKRVRFDCSMPYNEGTTLQGKGTVLMSFVVY